MPSLKMFMCSCLMAVAMCTSLSAQTVYLEQNGLVVIQAESVPLESGWEKQTSVSGYTGSGYIIWTGSDNFSTTGVGTIAYNFRISTPGTYTLKMRMNHKDATADDQWNDCWGKFDNETSWVKVFHPGANWQAGWTFHTLWEAGNQSYPEVTRTFSAGDHVLYLSGRSYGLKIDRIHLHHSSVSNLMLTTSPESPTSGGNLNQVPQVSAGTDRTLILPQNSLTLSGTATDDHTVASVLWSKISGPSATLSGQNSLTLSASGLVEGTYVFRLTATDDSAASAYDEMTVVVAAQSGSGTATVSGELKKWHKVTLTFDGPTASESATPNPFTDFRLNVTFVNGSSSLTVPGYFAADGDAANTGSTSGSKWRVHFTPSVSGTWTYVVSFRTGTNVAASTDVSTGTAVSPHNGTSGSIVIANTDKTGRDFRAKGIMRYVGEHYPKFDNGDYFVKAGSGDPENFLSFGDFDNTPTASDMPRHDYLPHVTHWQNGDPTWLSGKGKGIIGLVNYLSGLGCNTQYFLLWAGGDSKNGFPWTSSNSYLRYDCSKLDQWEIVFEQMTKKGMHLHMFFHEEEVDMALNSGNLGTETKVYFREMVARFGHHNALTWNLGEELNRGISYPGGTDPSTAQIKAWADYIAQLDPYDHPIGGHPFGISGLYTPLLGHSTFTAATVQTGDNLDQVHTETKSWITQSANAGHKWLVSNDEQGGFALGLEPTTSRMDEYRKKVLWGTLMAGGWGTEYYFGMEGLQTEDYTVYAQAWRDAGYAISFFTSHVRFWEMANNSSLVESGKWCLAKSGSQYVVYLPSGGTTTLNLAGASGSFMVKWFDPRNGGALVNGTVQQINGGGNVSIGLPPNTTTSDWVAFVSQGTGVTDQLGYTQTQLNKGTRILLTAGRSNLSIPVTISPFGNVSVEIYDLRGALLYKAAPQQAVQGVIRIDAKGSLGQLPKGQYLLRARTDRGDALARFNIAR